MDERKIIEEAAARFKKANEWNPRWRADELANAINTYAGKAPVEPTIDQSPNRGSGWMR